MDQLTGPSSYAARETRAAPHVTRFSGGLRDTAIPEVPTRGWVAHPPFASPQTPDPNIVSVPEVNEELGLTLGDYVHNTDFSLTETDRSHEPWNTPTDPDVLYATYNHPIPTPQPPPATTDAEQLPSRRSFPPAASRGAPRPSRRPQKWYPGIRLSPSIWSGGKSAGTHKSRTPSRASACSSPIPHGGGIATPPLLTGASSLNNSTRADPRLVRGRGSPSQPPARGSIPTPPRLSGASSAPPPDTEATSLPSTADPPPRGSSARGAPSAHHVPETIRATSSKDRESRVRAYAEARVREPKGPKGLGMGRKGSLDSAKRAIRRGGSWGADPESESSLSTSASAAKRIPEVDLAELYPRRRGTVAGGNPRKNGNAVGQVASTGSSKEGSWKLSPVPKYLTHKETEQNAP